VARRGSELTDLAIHWFEEAESRYKTTIFYTADMLAMGTDKRGALQVDARALRKDLKSRSPTAESASGKQLAELQSQKSTLTDVCLGDLNQRVVGLISNNGLAQGFVCKSKDFFLAKGYKPSEAVKLFITGKLTICECDRMLKAVFANTLCELIGDDCFDAAFPVQPSGQGQAPVLHPIQQPRWRHGRELRSPGRVGRSGGRLGLLWPLHNIQH
jgi:hypothetical protein